MPVIDSGALMMSSGVALGDDFAAMDAGAGADVDEKIRRADRLLIVLHHDHRVAEIAQALQRLQEPRIVALVQADGRLVEDVQDARQPGADLRGEPDALALAARQRAGGPREREILKPDVDEEGEALAHFLQHAGADLVLLLRQPLRQFLEPRARVAHRKLGHLAAYLRDVGMHINNLQRSVNDMEELVEIHDEPIGIADAVDASPIDIDRGHIAFENVTFHYGGHRLPLFDGLSVDIGAGECVGLVGRSGSGKTTFVKLVQRLYDVSGGRILIDGQDIAKATQHSLRSQIAIVQQDPILFHRSLAQNIAYGRPGAGMAAIEQAARLANAHEFILRLPKGYGTLVGERGVKLSGGERQRVALARAFLADARVLILDEATSSLNSESEALIQQAMERLMKGRTSIVIAHRLSTVRSLDRILVFDRGKIVEQGTHAALAARAGGIYRGLFERQATEFARLSAAE